MIPHVRDRTLQWLAQQHNLDVPSYEDFYNWCFENQRTKEQVLEDGNKSSLELFLSRTRYF